MINVIFNQEIKECDINYAPVMNQTPDISFNSYNLISYTLEYSHITNYHGPPLNTLSIASLPSNTLKLFVRSSRGKCCSTSGDLLGSKERILSVFTHSPSKTD